MSAEGTPRVRPPAVAGLFYPDDPHELDTVVRRSLAAAEAAMTDRRAGDGAPDPSPPPHAVVAPHAGYVYSGAVAASAYARVLPRRSEITRVVLLGPNHRVPLRSMAVPSVDALATPLGLVPVDVEARDLIVGHPQVVVDDRPDADEHSLEVHLPFLQVALGEGWSVLPIVVGQVPPEAVADVLELLWGGPETLVVVSTDLSHYHDDATARSLDADTAATVVARRWSGVAPDRACGAYPLRGLLLEAERRDLAVELVDLRTSADTAVGDPRRVVGYGAFTVG
jgi:AmmeMemoRadiSam system protein B